MKHDTISLRRRHLLIAGLAGAAAPGTLFAGQCSGTPNAAPAAAELYASGNGEAKLVVSGRILGAPDCRPLANATVEAWHADANGDCSGFAPGKQDTPLRASVTTDADGRFMLTLIAPAEYPGGPRDIPRQTHYRVSHQGHGTPVMKLRFASARGASDDRVAQLQRDNAGTWRATFGHTLA